MRDPAFIAPPVCGADSPRLLRPSSSGLGHHPFTVKTRVRFPLGVPFSCKTANPAWGWVPKAVIGRLPDNQDILVLYFVPRMADFRWTLRACGSQRSNSRSPAVSFPDRRRSDCGWLLQSGARGNLRLTGKPGTAPLSGRPSDEGARRPGRLASIRGPSKGNRQEAQSVTSLR